jgi:hypothetical protein
MKPRQLLEAARRLIDQPLDLTGGLWSRAATFLARQALEERMAEILVGRAPGSDAAKFSAQLLILGEVLGDRDLAAKISYTWAALSIASHDHELAPTSDELRDWLDAVEQLLKEPSKHERRST